MNIRPLKTWVNLSSEVIYSARIVRDAYIYKTISVNIDMRY